MNLSLGTILQQRYEIVRLIGSGGFGAVYETKDLRLGHRVALKQLMLGAAQAQRGFEREARILAALRHPALPKVSDYFVDPSGYFLVMEYIPGDSLDRLLAQQNGPFAVAQVVGWMEQLLDVLDYLHSQQPPVIHRDIKPANIAVTPSKQIVLLDFGISKGGVARGQTLTGSSIKGFSLHYASLEQIEGQATDERSDLYSLGVTMHHLLTGTKPPTAITRAQAQVMQQPDPLPPINQLNPLVPAQLAQLLTDATNLNPNQRPSSAKTMRAKLNAQRSVKRRTTVLSSQRVIWALVAVAAILLVLIIGGLTIVLKDDGSALIAPPTIEALPQPTIIETSPRPTATNTLLLIPTNTLLPSNSPPPLPPSPTVTATPILLPPSPSSPSPPSPPTLTSQPAPIITPTPISITRLPIVTTTLAPIQTVTATLVPILTPTATLMPAPPTSTPTSPPTSTPVPPPTSTPVPPPTSTPVPPPTSTPVPPPTSTPVPPPTSTPVPPPTSPPPTSYPGYPL